MELNQKKNILWIAGTILANVFGYTLIFVIAYQILNLITYPFFTDTFGQIITYIASICVFVYSIKKGVLTVEEKSIIRKSKSLNISFMVVSIIVFIQIIILLASWYFYEIGLDPIRFTEFIVADLLFFFVTHFWLKKIVAENNTV